MEQKRLENLEKIKKNISVYHCEKCNYNTIKKPNYDKHLLTQKHIKASEKVEEKVVEEPKEQVEEKVEENIEDIRQEIKYLSSKQIEDMFHDYVLSLINQNAEMIELMRENITVLKIMRENSEIIEVFKILLYKQILGQK